MKLRPARLALLPLVVVPVVFVACSLNETGTAPFTDAGPRSAKPSSDARAADAAEPAAVPDDAATAPSGDEGDADMADAADDASPDAPSDGPQCDQDGDGYFAVSCGGNDCCDKDSRVHPGVTDFFEAKSACDSFDYDCDGQIQVEFGVAACQLGFFACSGNGLKSPASCGERASYVTCTWSGLTCSEQLSQRVQRCR